MKTKLLIIFTIACLACSLTACKKKSDKEKTMIALDALPPAEGVYAVIETEKGDILLNLEFEKTPMTVSNFVGLVEGTIENDQADEDEGYYDGLSFHRVIADFMIQGGCPLGTGTGGPGYKFADEIDPSLTHDGPGILSMANAGPGTNGSQFFITHTATPWLDGKHTVFGKVIEGMDVVNKIAQGDKIESIKILRKGAAAEAFKPDTASFKELQATASDRAKAAQAAQFESQFKKFKKIQPDAQKTDSGLHYVIVKEGDGKGSPKPGQSITCHYKGTFLDGKTFDSSYDRGEPLSFQIGQVIEGWNEALQLMSKGEKRILLIPSYLAYGDRGAGGVIPPNTPLIFEVELLDF